MKHTLLFILAILFTSTSLAQSELRKVKVLEIDSTKSYYFIKGKFKCKPKRGKLIIISRKDSTVVGENRIKKKKTYNLKLTNYFSEEEIKRLPAKEPGTLLLREEGYIIWNGKSDLPYISPNIKSLYYFGSIDSGSD